MGAFENGDVPDCNGNGIPDDQDLANCAGDPDCSDCNGNDVPDQCDIANCPSDPDCSDCNGNNIPDQCDIADCAGDLTCDDCNLNGVPDGCDDPVDSLPDKCVEWTGEGNQATWNDPKNWGGSVPGFNSSVTVSDAITNVFLDVDATIESLRLLLGAILSVTRETPGEGDLTVTKKGGILNLGSIHMANDRLIDVSGGLVTIGEGGKYRADPGAAGLESAAIARIVSASLTAANIILLPTFCGETDQMTLTDEMTVTTAGDFVMDGSGVNPNQCPFAVGRAALSLGGRTPPILTLSQTQFSVGASSTQQAGDPEPPTVTVGGAFRMLHAAEVCIGCEDEPGGERPRALLGGDFDNQSVFPSIFNWASGGLTFIGTTPQTFEVGGIDLGPTTDGFSTDEDALFDTNRHTNFSMGVIEVSSGSHVTFANVFLNTVSDDPCTEALYVHDLVLEAGSTVTIDNSRIYYQTLVEETNVTIETVGCGTLQVVNAAPDPLEDADDGLGGDYNRVGDFKMPTSAVAGGEEVTIRVKLNRMYIDKNEDASQCPVRAENTCNHDSNVSCSVDADCRPGGVCEPDDCGVSSSYCLGVLQSFEGQVRYLGAPTAFGNNAATDPKWVGAKLQCTPLVRDWNASALAADLGISEAEAGTVYYYGAEVVPCSIHAVQQATQSCVDSANEDCFSDPLEVRTAKWGDIWRFPSVTRWRRSRGSRSFSATQTPYHPLPAVRRTSGVRCSAIMKGRRAKPSTSTTSAKPWMHSRRSPTGRKAPPDAPDVQVRAAIATLPEDAMALVNLTGLLPLGRGSKDRFLIPHQS